MLQRSRFDRQPGRGFVAVTAISAALLPGLSLTVGIALLALVVQRMSGYAALSPLIVAMVLGIIFRNVWSVGSGLVPGIRFSVRTLLRFAIVLLGFQLTLLQIASVGLASFAAIAATLVATFVFMVLAGRALRVDQKLTELLAAGTSVCGASAVVATNSVTGGADEDVAYAIACVTVFGSLSMVLFPFIGSALALQPVPYGVWVGATVHEVAQATGAAFQGGPDAGQIGTVAKLTRVMMLAPLVLTLGVFARRRNTNAGNAAAPFPWFVLGFVIVVLVNSGWPLQQEVRHTVADATSFLLSIALAAMGLETDIRKLGAKGLRPLALGALGWIFISCLGLLLVSLV